MTNVYSLKTPTGKYAMKQEVYVYGKREVAFESVKGFIANFDKWEKTLYLLKGKWNKNKTTVYYLKQFLSDWCDIKIQSIRDLKKEQFGDIKIVYEDRI